MASPHTRPYKDPPLADDTAATGEVVDGLLWALAVAVASAHRVAADGLCTNLQCHGQRAPCGPARTAHAAAQLACRVPNSPVLPPRVRQHPARGRAAVPDRPSGRAGLFAPPEPTSPVDAVTDPTVFTPFRRPLAAATQQTQEECP